MAKPRTRQKKKPGKMAPHKFLERAVQKQHEAIGLEYTPGTVLPEGWYTNHTWTRAQRERFKAWFVKTMVERLGESKTRAEKAWAWWDLGYGWREIG